MSTINEGDTISIKLMSGEEVVARLIKDTERHLMIQRPMAIVNLSSGIGLGPFMFTTPKFGEMPINKGNIVTYVKTEVAFAKKYAAVSYTHLTLPTS